METRFKVNFSYSSKDTDFETNFRDSKTVPDQTIPLSEIIYRYQSGLPLPRINDYSDDSDDTDFDNPQIRLDTDIVEVQQELAFRREKIERDKAELSKAKEVTVKKQEPPTE